MSDRARIVGFDRKIRLAWLDAVAARVADGLSPEEIRRHMDRLLEGEVSGSGSHSARGKTITVLSRVWAKVPNEVIALRDEGIELWRAGTGRERLPLHWGMCLAAYPFFGAVATAVGRLSRLQGTFALSQVTRRVVEEWGQRSTVSRSTQRIVRSMVDWEVIRETKGKGLFETADPWKIVDGDPVGPWLLEATAQDPSRTPSSLRRLERADALFPVRMRVSLRDVSDRPGLELHRQGLEEVVLRVPAAS